MWVYWILFISIGLTALSKMQTVVSQARTSYRGTAGFLWFSILVMIIGWRHEVGGDWFSYLYSLESLNGKPFGSNFSLVSDLGYQFFNWVGSNIWGGIYLVNIVCASIFSWGLLSYCKFQPRPELALLVAVPFLIVVVSMGYTRQAAALGFAMVALIALQTGRFKQFLFLIGLAAIFHKSALIFLPFSMFYAFKNRLLIILAMVLSISCIYVFLLQEYIYMILGYYVDLQYNSSGAGVRVAMNALPAAIFLIWRNRFDITNRQRNFWTWLSFGALCLIPLLFLLPSSTVVDRLALYWIPLQLMVWSHVPCVLGKRQKRNPVWVSAIIIYSAAVLFTWIFFAEHRMLWLPYQFYPLVWVWS